MSQLAPENWYAQEDKSTRIKHHLLKNTIRRIAFIRLALFLLFPIAVYLFAKEHISEGIILFLAALVSFLLAVKKSLELKKELHQLDTALILLKLETNSLAGLPSGIDTGLDLLDLKHPYAHDLDVFGRKSLWHYLNRTLSSDGRKGLAESILQASPSIEKIRERQEIVAELAQDPSFLLQFRVAGISETEQPASVAQSTNWLNESLPLLNKPLVKWGRYIFPAITIILWAAYLIQLAPVSLLLASIGLNMAVLGQHIRIVNSIHRRHSDMPKVIAHHLALINIIAKQEFKNTQLKLIQDSSKEAQNAVNQLHILLNRFDMRLNGFMGILLNSLFLFDYHCLFAIEQWKIKYKDVLLKSLNDRVWMEQYVSLANFSYQHPSFIYPEINNDETMQAIGLFHPLIHGNIIANTLELGQQEQVILLTGANMTGKSTWLRAIGLNAVLAYSGLPIAAKSACLPLMHIYTSMRITDDLEEGISYFKAEITRLQTLLTSIRLENSKWLVLLDEPLRGTNSGDKQAGTIGLIKNLLNLPAIGILATHDAALSVLEIQYPGKISNYHFDSSISGNELTFDYTLKSGCSTSNNATTLMRLNGILLDET
jgi:hypothetical protein